VQVSIAWLKDHPEAYRALCKLWASKESITKFMRVRECRGIGGSGHTYGPDGHICMGQRMVRKIITKMHSHFIFFVTNSYPQERASGQRPPDMKFGRGVIGEVTLQTLTSCALWWKKLDW
jgi:hypothetical protein